MPYGNCEHDYTPLTRERLKLLTRVYHSSHYASVATGFKASSITRAAKRFGLRFRLREDGHDVEPLERDAK